MTTNASPFSTPDFKNPSEISLGLGIGKANKWYAGLEYVNSQKSNFNNRSFNNEDVIFDDASKFKVGGFFMQSFQRKIK